MIGPIIGTRIATLDTNGPDDTLEEGEGKEEQETTTTKAPTNHKAEAEVWKLYTDKASNEHGSRAGLRIATKMKVEKIHAFVDSKLVANQVEGSYEVKGEKTKKYKEKGIDIIGPLPEAPGKIKYLIVAVDYFTKWIEAKAVTSIIGKQVKKFAFDNIICRFGIPATIITNNETQLINDPFKSWAEGLGIKLVSTSVYHPQANGAVERANQSIMQGIKTRLHQKGGAWVEELPNVLWAHKTTPKMSNGETTFSLAYGTKAVIPSEIGIPTRRRIQGPDEENKEALRMNLNLLEEKREIAAIREARQKQLVEKCYNQRVYHKQFKVGEFVLLKNKLSKVESIGKLRPK
nr:reverse transcriptase domain-containing protein [Tanacetum cinerariifolium]